MCIPPKSPQPDQITTLFLYITEIITYEYLQVKESTLPYRSSFLSTDYHTLATLLKTRLSLAFDGSPQLKSCKVRKEVTDLMIAHVSLFEMYISSHVCSTLSGITAVPRTMTSARTQSLVLQLQCLVLSSLLDSINTLSLSLYTARSLQTNDVRSYC